MNLRYKIEIVFHVPIFSCNVPGYSRLSQKISRVSRFPAKSPGSRKNFPYLPKQHFLALSPPVDWLLTATRMPCPTSSCNRPSISSRSYVNGCKNFVPVQVRTGLSSSRSHVNTHLVFVLRELRWGLGC